MLCNLTRNTYLIALTLFAAIFSNSLAIETVQIGDQHLQELFQKWLNEEFERHPTFATALGNHEFDGFMDDLSAESQKSDLERDNRVLAELIKFQHDFNLNRDSEIDLEIWMNHIKFRIWRATNANALTSDPRVYLEYCSDSVYNLLTQSTLPRERNVLSASQRIGFIPKVIESAKQSLKNPPRILTEVAMKRVAGAIAFYESDIFLLAEESPQISPLAQPCKKAAAALKEYQNFLEKELLAQSTGRWQLGKEKFAEKLDFELDAGLSAQQVIDAAEAEANRVEIEMYYVAKQLWHRVFPNKTLPPDDTLGRHETVRAVLAELGKNHNSSDKLVEDARKTVDDIKSFISKRDVLKLPSPDRCKIIEMPEFQRGFSAAYLNPAPPLDPNGDSLYAISPPPSDWPDSRKEAFLQEYNHSMLQILTIHEAYPGHYVQLHHANAAPSLIRKVLSSGVFAEGWAVYTEQMMLDEGYASGDLALRLHQLKFYMRAVLNAILDHHMHCSDLTDEAALEMLTKRGFQTEGEAVGKVQRAKQSSCQLSTYFTGRTAFYRLRQSVQRNRGEAFNLSDYHEEVLKHGTLPVKYLPELVK